MMSWALTPSCWPASAGARSQAPDDGVERDAAAGVGLRVEEDLGVARTFWAPALLK